MKSPLLVDSTAPVPEACVGQVKCLPVKRNEVVQFFPTNTFPVVGDYSIKAYFAYCKTGVNCSDDSYEILDLGI